MHTYMLFILSFIIALILISIKYIGKVVMSGLCTVIKQIYLCYSVEKNGMVELASQHCCFLTVAITRPD